MGLHDALLERMRPGDRVVYLGNYGGYSPDTIRTLDEVLTFRRIMLSIPGVMAGDLVYLRGTQEEMWEKLLQLQFAPDPVSALLWMLGNGLAPTLQAYGLCPHEAVTAAREGIMSLTKWSARVRECMRRHAGHEIFLTQLRRAAFTLEQAERPLLFVHAGIDPARPLNDQGDSFWWSGSAFNAINIPYTPFHKVIRGFDPRHGGLNLNCVTATIDGGCGFGGSLVCAGFDRSGQIFSLMEA